MNLITKTFIPLLVFLFTACAKEDNGPMPEVISNATATAIGGTSATVGGNVIWMDGFTIEKRGVCYATTSNPSIKNTNVYATAYAGNFSCKLNNLKLNTVYYARAFATYTSGITVYGNVISFTTTNELSMKKTAIYYLTKNSATLVDSIFSDGGLEITARGVCYGTSPQPTYAGASHTSDGRGAGKFTSILNNLGSHATYFARPYLINSTGTTYGEEITFTTLGSYPSNPVTDIDGNTYQTIQLGDQVWMAENLRVTHFKNGDPIPNVNEVSFRPDPDINEIYQLAYNKNEQNAPIYGRFYSWNVGTDERGVAPEGWRVPSYSDYQRLFTFLNANGYVFNNISNATAKTLASKTSWQSSSVDFNTGWQTETNNSTDFNGLPVGYYSGTQFTDFGKKALFQTTDTHVITAETRPSPNDPRGTIPTAAGTYSKTMMLSYTTNYPSYNPVYKCCAVSIRCIKN